MAVLTQVAADWMAWEANVSGHSLQLLPPLNINNTICLFLPLALAHECASLPIIDFIIFELNQLAVLTRIYIFLSI